MLGEFGRGFEREGVFGVEIVMGGYNLGGVGCG